MTAAGRSRDHLHTSRCSTPYLTAARIPGQRLGRCRFVLMIAAILTLLVTLGGVATPTLGQVASPEIGVTKTATPAPTPTMTRRGATSPNEPVVNRDQSETPSAHDSLHRLNPTPTSTPIDTPTPAPPPSSTPTPTPTPTAPAEPSPSTTAPSSTPSPSATPDDSALPDRQRIEARTDTPDPDEGDRSSQLQISQAAPVTAEPGDDVTFTHTVSHAATLLGPITVDLMATSERGYPVWITLADDRQQRTARGEHMTSLSLCETVDQCSATVILTVTLPDDAELGEDLITFSASLPGGTPDTTITTTNQIFINSEFRIAFSTHNVDLGVLSPTGDTSGSAPGVIATVDSAGATFVKPSAVTVTVVSSAPWTVGCAVLTGNSGWGSTQATRLDAIPVATDRTKSNADCVVRGQGGTISYSLDIRVRIEWTDPPGELRYTLVFAERDDAESGR